MEGPAVQILHLGSDDEVSSIRKLYASVAESGFRASGALHELVIADPNAVGQARARSILRVPIAYEWPTSTPESTAVSSCLQQSRLDPRASGRQTQ
jgi:hypothetical protein